MPAPPFLVGLSAGASVAVARIVARSGDSNGTDGKGAVGIDKLSKRTPVIVKPRRFTRVPESGVPEEPCVKCAGCGRVTCPDCEGRGRTNMIELAMLPKSVWPEWCGYCRGSGKVYCSRCQGQGNYRQKLGFDMDD